jgi:hypothetical protein
MKIVTVEKALTFGWGCTEEILAIAGSKTEWTALDVLRLTNVPAKVRRDVVLSPEFLEDDIMHEIACRYAEDVFGCIESPDLRSLAAIEMKRRWMRGEDIDDELYDVWRAANDFANTVFKIPNAATMSAEYAVAKAAACAAADSAWDAAWDAAASAAWAVAFSVADVVVDPTAWIAALNSAYERQVEMLIILLEEAV